MRDAVERRSRRQRGPGLGTAAWSTMVAAAAVSSSAVAAPPMELSVTAARPLPLSAALADGRIEQRQLSLHGIPVRGAYETVRLRDDRAPELLSYRHPIAAPQLRPEDARIDPGAVAGLVAAAEGTADAPPLERDPQLVYLMVLGQPVLTWETQVALQMWPEPTRPTYWVSAATGRVLAQVEQVRSSRARVFLENPAITPEPVEVELRDIDVDGAGHPLVGARVQAFNCVGDETEEVSPWWEEDECWPVQTVFSDEQGDFFVPIPDVLRIEDNTDASDSYAELSMYVHAERFLDAMRARGIEQFRCEFSSMLANFRSVVPSATLDYGPLNNAFYTNQCDPERGPTMIFGQGSEVDFGYDADVIYHELGHGMVALLAPEGLNQRRLRSDSAGVDAGGINEALADYFSVMLTDDAHLADYVGRFWSTSGRAYIRDAENAKVCPDNTVGQVHNDGEPFMAALWATRKRLDGDAVDALDRSVIEALMRMSPDADLEEASALVLEMAEREVGRGTLTAAQWDLLERSFEARGVLDCPRVITDPAAVEAGRSMILRRFDDGVYPFYPGPMQLRYQVPDDAQDMIVAYTLRSRSAPDPVEARVLVKRGDAPIEFEYELVAVDDPPLEPPGDGELDDPVRELVLVTGDWDLELTGVELRDSDYEARLGGLEPGEVLHFMLVNVTRPEAVASGVAAFSSSARPEDDPSEGVEGTGADAMLPAVDEVSAAGGGSSCACRGAGTGAGGGAAAWAWAWALLLLARRRR